MTMHADTTAATATVTARAAHTGPPTGTPSCPTAHALAAIRERHRAALNRTTASTRRHQQ